MACGVRLMRRPVAEALPLYGDLHRFIPALALREGYRVDEVPVPQHPGDARTRVYGPGVYLRRLLDIAAFFFLAKFTEKPLRFFGLVGSVFLLAGARHQPRAAGRAARAARASPTGRSCCSRCCWWRWACSSWDWAWWARSSSTCVHRTGGRIGCASRSERRLGGPGRCGGTSNGSPGKRHDLLVVGGGIYGACIAWDAALRGVSVALVDRDDFGAATSANSLRIVHGGLRYLARGEFARMRESIRERSTLLRIAPGLVVPLPVLVPTHGTGTQSRMALRAALAFNDLGSAGRNRGLDADHRIPAGRMLSRERSGRLLPPAGSRRRDRGRPMARRATSSARSGSR